MTTVCVPLEEGDSNIIPEPRCPVGFKIARCKVCGKELSAAGHFCPEHIPVFIIPENKRYKA